MKSWKDVPVKGKFEVLKDSNNNALKIGEIYEYDTSNMLEGDVYDEQGIAYYKVRYKSPYQKSAANIVKGKEFVYILLTDVKFLKSEYFNKIIFKKL